jgi:type IV pilus assembly protein PilB
MTALAGVPTDDKLAEIATRLESVVRQRRDAKQLLGELLFARGLVSLEELDTALTMQRERGLRLGEMLVEMGALSSAQLGEVLGEHLGVRYVDLAAETLDPMLTSIIPEGLARRHRAVVVARDEHRLVVAMANPKDVFAIDDLQMLTGEVVDPVLADSEHLNAAIDRAYRHTEIENTIEDVTDAEAGDETPDDDGQFDDGPTVRLVNAILEQAISDRASDIHIEPSADLVRVRQRIDGVLHDTSEASRSVLRPLLVRLKILAGLDISQTRIPQDGRFSCKIDGRSVDARVSTLPTTAGESAVIRILDPDRDNVNLASLGLSPDEHRRLVPHFFARQGAVFVTGPTGAGKTSTLYAALAELHDGTRSIVTIEYPVEYRVDGVKQMQINTRAGVTFPTALRSVLRADPDVVLVGEVRDAETAEISASASITGHLVLSTLHTTSAAATPLRLVDMGVEPYVVASALTCVVSQRLARKLCDDCAQEVADPDLDLLRELGAPESILEGATVRSPVGCASCRHTGYHGRLPIFEIMPVSEDIRRAIIDRRAPSEIEAVAVGEGMDTLRVAALRRVVRGELSIDELLRTIV